MQFRRWSFPAALLATSLLAGVVSGPVPDSTDWTSVSVTGQVSAEAARVSEGRRFTHSDLQPTGRWVERGDRVQVDVPSGTPPIDVSIGLYGAYAAHNDGKETPFQRKRMSTGLNTVEASVDGMLYLVSGDGHDSTVRVAGGERVPQYVRGTTSATDFAEQMRTMPDAPFVEVVSDRMMGAFQAPKTRSAIAADDLAARTADWDDVVALTNRTYGLLDDAVGVARKHPHRIMIASADTSVGYANAGHARIMFQVSTGAASALFADAPRTQWALWHEIGHTYEAPLNTFPGTAETTTNISPLAIQDAQGYGSRWDESVQAFRDYFASADRNWETAHDRIRLLLWEQLRRAFGDEYLPRFFQALRVENALLNTNGISNDRKRALVAETAARVADRDLTPFFDALGFPLTEATRDTLADLPPLTTRIWDNVDSRDRIVEERQPAYSVPVATASTTTTEVVFGQDGVDVAASDVRNTDGSGSARLIGGRVFATAAGTGAAALYAELVNDRDITELIAVGTADATHGNSIVVTGDGNRVVLTAALDAQSGRLRLVPATNYEAGTAFGSRPYVTVTLRDSNGAVLQTGTVAGNQTARVIEAVFDRLEVADGMTLGIDAVRADSASLWTDGTDRRTQTWHRQEYRITDGRFVPVAHDVADAVLGAGGPAATLSRTAPTPVEARFGFARPVTRLDAELEFRAPEGTRFVADQSFAGEYLAPSAGEWRTSANLDLRDVTVSADGRVLRGRIVTGSSFTQLDGAMVRWKPSLSVDRGTSATSGAMTTTVSGTWRGPDDGGSPTAFRATTS